MTALQGILAQFREMTLSERDKGTSFENLMVQYFKTEPFYKEQYADVLSYFDWVNRYGADLGISTKKDTGIDLVAITSNGEFHAIQCKNYSPDHTISKSDIDSFFTASGKTYFSHRIIVATTDKWTDNAQDSLESQHPPVSRIDLHNLENSVIDWSQYHENTKPVLKAQKQLREHQITALNSTIKGLNAADRGKLIMACGTGKTFTSLKIAEALAGKGKRVLFLVPSLSLLGQSLTEWTQESAVPLKSFAVCSDSDVGKRQGKNDDRVIAGISDLQYPATTNAASLQKHIGLHHSDEAMTVVFSTYHSIGVLNEAQTTGTKPILAFDLIICDEAHRTTGATFEGEEESAFVRIHDNRYIEGTKRLYMTATPRIYGDDAKQTEKVTLCSMDDKSLYGEELYVISFSEAVSRKLLVDYKVIVLAVEEAHVNRRLQSLLKDADNSLKVDDAAKIVGCWKALSKQGLVETMGQEPNPMKRAVAFCQVIDKEYKGKNHKVSSKLISEMFGAVVAQYQEAEIESLREKDPDALLDKALTMACEAEHVDGGMNASEKEAKLEWLKATTEDNTCRILSNVRCLSEGVDVPALDAVLFLTPRSSQVDVVQSVGRVMRLAPGKELGYVILPVVIPAGVEPEEALNSNETYKVVWQVLNALRSHDDRFDAMINKLEFNGSMHSKMEVVAVADKVAPKATRKSKKERTAGKARDGRSIGSRDPKPSPEQAEMVYEIGDIERALYAKIVKKCGNRHHWEDWANDIAKIANTHIDRIQAILEDDSNTEEIEAFNAFAHELRDDLNNSIPDAEIIEMLAQHLITKPVFDALFEEYSFAKHNPMSQAMQQVLDKLQEHSLDKERSTLESFYASVKMRAEGINSAEGKQRIIVELYDKFFANAFPRMTDRLGIVYTPIEVVDFILHSVENILKTEFNSSMADENVHILDPFTGTGTFITRLLQSGIIPADRLPHKYKHEIHANELVLLAYYIAAINIEATYHGILTGNVSGDKDDLIFEPEYEPFTGICLTDTFQMGEKADMVDELLEENSARRKRQQALDIRVIVGNPPYSAGQTSENDNNKNINYPLLDERIRTTYVKRSGAVLSKGLYDSYIRAIRWSSDRIKDRGVIGFVTNGGFIEANTADGLRRCLSEEFSNLYVFHLRGNQRTSGERSRKEGGKIFGSGSRAPIAISILVKNPQAKEHGKIYFHDIGNYLTREQKLEIVSEFGSIGGITQQAGWQTVEPDEFGDWLNQRDPFFDTYMVLGEKKEDDMKVFENFSQGVLTARDFWVYNASRVKLEGNMSRMIDFYNDEVERFNAAHPGLDKKSREVALNDFIDTNPECISWTRSLKQELAKNRTFNYQHECTITSLYRPFSKRWMYFNRTLNEMVYQMPRIFPEAGTENLVIHVSGVGARSFSAFVTNCVPCFDNIEKGQAFPLYLYESKQNQRDDLLSQGNEIGYEQRDAITDDALEHFQSAYPNATIIKEDIFYYIYGLLHNEDFRERYADNLSKQLPRIPRLKQYEDFAAFAQAGRDLAVLHLDYETLDLNTQATLSGSLGLRVTEQGVKGGQDVDFTVTKMKFAKRGDKSKVIYNGKITIENIPEDAYDYVVNGKPALEWVMERQAVTTDKKSGIVNDANDWAIETMGNARYPLELFLRVITVSLRTQAIVRNLPKLDIL
ncbi:DEAD/DEAH box helicase family protein [Halomonas sp. KG2]|uniref:DEAD/DEAH box helicase n=1 Tax=Halomonas sp. KG2 TaxID=2951138 RepID=UPI002647F8D0|nr:type ISP restriction/modification enzyme [Halomonas sp. KG2]WKD30223.1 DEAD/DEAH box helicase family protein [Halomonas sp. KG2]